MIEKKELRKRIKALKNELTAENKQRQAEIVYKKLEASDEFRKANTILMYWAMSDEMPTKSFINKWFADKEIYLPVVDGDDLRIVKYEGEDKMVPGAKYGIPEPAGPEISDESQIELVIVPGVAFDADNNRMGRGAGYYDRILNRIPKAKKLALAFDFQMVDKVPTEPHDIKMDQVIHA